MGLKQIVAACAAWAIAGLAACVGTETGNPTFTGQLSYNTHSTQPAVAALRASEGGIEVDNAWLVLGDARFVRASECDMPELSPVHVDGLGAGDHAAPAAPSTPFELEAGPYCALRLPFERADGPAAGAPDTLTGHSVLLIVHLADGREARIESAFEGDVSVAALSDTFEMDAARADLLVAFDVATWLDGIGLEQASAGADGVIVVNDERNAEVLAAFEARLAAGVGLYRDPSKSGQVAAAGEQLAVGE